MSLFICPRQTACTQAVVFSIGVREEVEIGDKWPEVLSISSSYTETAFRSSIKELQIYKALNDSVIRWDLYNTLTGFGIHSFVTLSALRQVHNLFQSEVPRQRNLVLSLSISPNPVLSCSCLCLLSRLPNLSILPSKKCFTRQFPCKMRTFQLVFLHFIVCMILLSSLTPSIQPFVFQTKGWTDLLRPSPAPNFKNFNVLFYVFSKALNFQHHTQLSSKEQHLITFFHKCKYNLSKIFSYTCKTN